MEDKTKHAPFLREATGLVREAGAFDTLAMATYNASIGMGVLYLILYGPSLYPGSNLWLGVFLTSGLSMFGMITWSLMAIVFPRSGGDYIFNSRVLHPAIGFLTSTGWIVANFIWCAILAAYVANPGLSVVFALVGNNQGAAFMTSEWGTIVVGTIIIVFCTVLLVRSLRTYLVFQAVVFILSMVSLIVTLALLIPISRADFISAFNAFSARYGSPDYATVIKLAQGQGVVTNPGFSWGATIGLLPIAGWSMGFQYMSAFIAGETKKVSRNMPLGIIAGTILTGAFMAFAGWLYVDRMGYDFLLALPTVWSLPQYTLPVGPYFNFLAGVLTTNTAVLVLVGLNLALWNLVYPALSLVGQSRIALAWSFDRLIPSWFGDVSERFHTPVKNLIFFGVCGEVVLLLYATYLGLLGSYTAGITEWCTTFACVAVAGIVLPYRKKVKHIYEASPVSKYKILGIPVMTFCSAIYLFYCAATVYFYYTCAGLGEWSIPSMSVTGAVLAGSVVYFFIIRSYRKKQGIDIDLAFKELPPE